MRVTQFAYMLPGAIVAAVVIATNTAMSSAAPLLTATSVVTGGTFAMATTFWGKSVDARRSPAFATDGHALTVFDQNRSHMIWTVFVGVVGAATLAMGSIFGTPMPMTAACAALFSYLITLVGVGILRFAEAAVLLR